MYRKHIVSYLKFRRYTDPTKLLKGNVKLLESYLVEYLKSEKEKNLSYSTLNQKFSAFKKFYIENDIENLRWYKIHKILGRNTKKTGDRTYTHQEIQKLLRYADHRMKLVIFLLASTGMRIGALTLQLQDLLYYKNENIYQFRVYTNDTKEEYITFCTPECSNALKEYLEYRKSKGELLTEKSWLIPSHFRLKIKDTKMEAHTIGNELSILLDKCNIVPLEHRTETKYVIRKQIMRLHGFRKFFTTMCIESKVDAERREMMLGHSLGITSHYCRPTSRQLLDEYMKAVNLLTINEENRLKEKNYQLQKELENQNQMYTKVEKDLQELKDILRSKGHI
jgi:integrase